MSRANPYLEGRPEPTTQRGGRRAPGIASDYVSRGLPQMAPLSAGSPSGTPPATQLVNMLGRRLAMVKALSAREAVVGGAYAPRRPVVKTYEQVAEARRLTKSRRRRG